MFNKKHTIWVEKYRPDTLEGYIGNEFFVEKLNQWIGDNDMVIKSKMKEHYQ